MQQSARFGIENYQRLEEQCVKVRLLIVKRHMTLVTSYVLERPVSQTDDKYLIKPKKNWNYHNAFFFAGTLATTIGYGNVVPRTDNGRIFCLIFVALGEISADKSS